VTRATHYWIFVDIYVIIAPETRECLPYVGPAYDAVLSSPLGAGMLISSLCHTFNLGPHRFPLLLRMRIKAKLQRFFEKAQRLQSSDTHSQLYRPEFWSC
jgi:hypothetical protein